MAEPTDAVRQQQREAFARIEGQVARAGQALDTLHAQPGAAAATACVVALDALAADVARLRESVSPTPPRRAPGLLDTLWRTFFGGS